MAKTKSRGCKRMMELGYKPVLLLLTREDHRTIEKAGKIAGLRKTQFLIFHGLAAARKTISDK